MYSVPRFTRLFGTSMRPVRVELTTLGLLDLRATNCAIAADASPSHSTVDLACHLWRWIGRTTMGGEINSRLRRHAVTYFGCKAARTVQASHGEPDPHELHDGISNAVGGATHDAATDMGA